ncbi:RNA polymerase sigma factor [Streptomyces sp. NPDC091292]|uniref:RNA polymerase sigma factor n=1 Tax=Streptomyces sp. NPDC091292 TaxID=3365991 RepID=UPI0037F721F1
MKVNLAKGLTRRRGAAPASADDLLRELIPRLRRHAARSTPMWLAEDAVQDTCERLLLNADTLVRHPNPAAYALRTVTTVLIDHHRRRVREVPAGEVPERAVGSASGDVESALDINWLLERLPPGQAAAVRLVDVEDHTIDQAAELLGLHRGTVSRSRARGLTTLRQKFSANRSYEGWP